MPEHAYRSDLDAAHHHIAQLEEELGRRPRRRRLHRLVAVLGPIAAGGLLFMGCVGATAFVATTRSASQSVAEAPPPVVLEATMPKKRLHASWYPQSDVLPVIVDVDGDGTKDLVGLLWNASDDARPLYVAAIDGKTFDLIWSAGPFPSQWHGTRTHLAVAGDKVVVTDSQDEARVLSLRTGEVVRSTNVPGGFLDACVPEREEPGHVAVRLGTAPLEWKTFDLATTAITPAAKGQTCKPRWRACNELTPGAPCQAWGRPAGVALPDPKAAMAGPTLFADDVGITITRPTAEGHAPTAVAFDRAKKNVLWKGPLAVEGDVVHYGETQSRLDRGHLATLFQTKAGPYRLVVHNARTGSETWNALVPRTQEGSHVSAWGFVDRFVVVVSGQTLHVFDAATGEHLRGLDATTT